MHLNGPTEPYVDEHYRSALLFGLAALSAGSVFLLWRDHASPLTALTMLLGALMICAWNDSREGIRIYAFGFIFGGGAENLLSWPGVLAYAESSAFLFTPIWLPFLWGNAALTMQRSFLHLVSGTMAPRGRAIPKDHEIDILVFSVAGLSLFLASVSPTDSSAMLIIPLAALALAVIVSETDYAQTLRLMLFSAVFGTFFEAAYSHAGVFAWRDQHVAILKIPAWLPILWMIAGSTLHHWHECSIPIIRVLVKVEGGCPK